MIAEQSGHGQRADAFYEPGGFWSLRRQLLGVLLASLSLLLIASGVVLRGPIFQSRLNVLIEHYTRSVDGLVPFLQDHVITRDAELDIPVLERMASEYIQLNPEVLEFELRDGGRRMLVDIKREREDAGPPEMVHELQRTILAGEHPVGLLSLVLDLRGLHREASENVRSLQLMITLTIGALAVILVLWFDRLAGRPIQILDRRLRTLIDEDEGADEGEELHLSGAPELVRLGESLNLVAGAAKLRRHEEELKEQLQQAQKLESVGRLAGGVAHDFNNLLTVILGYAEAIKQRNSLPPDVESNADQILAAGRRASALTKQLLAFSRKQVLNSEDLDLVEVLRGIEPLLRHLIDATFDIELLAQEDAGLVKADRAQIEQVILNLTVNARDAMDRGGAIVFRVYDAGGERDLSPRPLNLPPGDWVILEVADSGSGMDAETLEHIFEPFFTTKGASEGTGLGLSMAYGIVQQSGGVIDVQSAEGEGTTFRIYLPSVGRSAKAVEAHEIPVQPTMLKMSNTAILLVEDEELVRVLTVKLLKGAGYEVVTAPDAEKGLAIIRQDRDRFRLIATDLNLPGMSGAELLEVATAEIPDLEGLLISGFDAGLLGPAERRFAFLQKPFDKEELLQKVAGLIGEAQRDEGQDLQG